MENSENTVEFRFGDFMNFLRERALKFTLITVILMGVAAVATHLVTTFMIPTEYESNSKVLIEGKSSDVIINNYREIIGSRTVLMKAIEETGVEVDVEDLMKKVNVSAEKDANFLTISVLADSSYNAMKLNKTITSEFVEVAQPLAMGNDKLKLKVFDTASMPSDPVNKNYLRNDGIAAAVVLMISLFVMYNAFLSKQVKQKENKEVKETEKTEDTRDIVKKSEDTKTIDHTNKKLGEAANAANATNDANNNVNDDIDDIMNAMNAANEVTRKKKHKKKSKKK